MIPGTGCVNAVAFHLEKMIRGTKAINHHQGCLHPPTDTEQVTRTLINLGKNPNVAAVLLIGLGCEMVLVDAIYEGIKESGKLVDVVAVHEIGGMFDTIGKGAKIATDMVVKTSGIVREKCGLDKTRLRYEVRFLRCDIRPVLQPGGRDSLCCGGEGGRLFTDVDEQHRPEHMRVEHVLEVGTDVVAAACPWCNTLLRTAVTDLKLDDKIQFMDVSEILVEALDI